MNTFLVFPCLISNFDNLKCNFKNIEMKKNNKSFELYLPNDNLISIYERGKMTDLWTKTDSNDNVFNIYCRIGKKISLYALKVLLNVLENCLTIDVNRGDTKKSPNLRKVCENLEHGLWESADVLKKLLKRMLARKRWNLVLCWGRICRNYQSFINEYYSPSFKESPGGKGYISAMKDFESKVKVLVLQSADTLGENIKTLSKKYSIAIENSVGVRNININDEKAFHYFQNAAYHGSTAGFYNLGLCYQLGKGTKVNLNVAAHCYIRAAMKGHGLASFNLAVFFNKGIGGLPVDTKIAKELLAEAAEKNVVEAQLYFGILFLEEKKWSDAVRIFSDLVEKNVPCAQYYLELCCKNGLGVQRNEKVALELFKKSGQGYKQVTSKLKNNKIDCSGSEALHLQRI